MSQLERCPLRREGCEPHVKIPSLRPYTGKMSSITLGFENQWGYIRSKSQNRCGSLKSSWVI